MKFAHPVAIAALPPAVVVLWVLFDRQSPLTFALSVLAITMTQLVLRAQEADTAAIHRKLDELVHSIADADDAVAGCEQ